MNSTLNASGRVVVTGIGAITPLGLDFESTWSAALAGESGIGLVTTMDCSDFTTKIAGEIKGFEPENWMDRKDARRIDRFMAFSVAVSKMALQDSGLVLTEELKEHAGVIIGSGIGGLNTMTEQSKILFEKGPTKVSPFFVPYMIPDMGSGITSIMLDLRGPNHTVISACSTSANAIGDAYHFIKRGDATVMIAGGAEAPINPIGMSAFCAARAMSTRNDEPKRASRPWDKERDGFVMSEGACVFMLEDYDHAKARGAKIYAEILGYGMSADAYHITAPHPEGRGARKSMLMAIDRANLKPTDIVYLNAHATSTNVGDPAELKAIKGAFGDHAYDLHLSSTKSMHGHTLGAAGAIESMMCILAMRDSIIPPTINLENPDDGIDLDLTPNVAVKADIPYSLNNSFGFGGHNVSLVLKRGE